jgi:hypothetical protein
MIFVDTDAYAKTVIAAIYILGALALILHYQHKRLLLGPAVLITSCQSIMFCGSLPLLDLSLPSDRVHLSVMCISLAVYATWLLTLGAVSGLRRHDVVKWKARTLTVPDGHHFNLWLLALVAVSILVSALYYAAAGQNVFIASLRSSLSTGSGLPDVAARRLAMYSEGSYIGAGYVNQFKNTVLPLIVLFLSARYLLLRGRKDLLYVAVLTPFTLLFLLGTGQRGQLIFVLEIGMLFYVSVLPFRTARRVLLRFLGVGLCFLFLSTLFLGRVERSANTPGVVPSIAKEIVERAFVEQQRASVIGFRYVYGQDTQYGQEWLDELAGILPSHRGSTLANDVHAQMYGSARGTAPPSIWGVAWYNLGWVGVVLSSVVLASLAHFVQVRMVRGRRCLYRVMAYAAFSVVLANWVAGGPAFLLNTGGLTIVMLRYLPFLRLKRQWLGAPGKPWRPQLGPEGWSA